MADRLHSNEYIYWAKATLGLKITKDCLCSAIEEKMTEFVIELNDQDDHLRTSFLPKKILTAGRVKFQNSTGDEEKWQFQSRCNRCRSMFTKILEHHTNRRHRSINWQCHHPSEQDSAPVWWIVAKIFMPGNNISCMRPQEADPLALFGLIKNCKLFSTLSTFTQEVIEVRNKLRHHSSNTITEQEMKDAMNKMKALLRKEMVKETSTAALNKIRQLEQKPIFLTKLSKENRKLVVQALQLKASSIEYEIKQQLGRSTKTLEPELQKTKDEIVKENDFYLDEIEKVEKTNAYLQEENQRLEKQFNDECAKGQQLKKDNDRLRKKVSLEDEKAQRYIKLTEEIKMMALERDLAATIKLETIKNEVSGGKAGGTVG